ncbi:MAG: 2-dehydropantoate 2-reductase [Candidatus Omnitrophica bacterium]|nr:2-dehydropantoate 2-reductase [Candidatus Omnitrophota bacterium]
MKIAVIGAGAIGGLIAGYLKLKGIDVLLVAHPESAKIINSQGLKISGVRGDFNIKIDALTHLNLKPDLVILATKTQDLNAALKDNLNYMRDIAVLTTQNGIRAEEVVAQYILRENIISSIVMFGATYLNPAEVVHNFEGSWIMGKAFTDNDDLVVGLSKVLSNIFPTLISEDIKAMKYTKIFVNANNCIPAILGKSMQEVFSDIEISKISIAIWKEGLEIINKAKIKLASLPDFPLERLTKLTSLPIPEAAKIFSAIMVNLSKEPLYGSILQSIKRGRASEIDYLNGEFVRIAKENNLKAPLNESLVNMVHAVEKNNCFFSKAELLEATRGWVN